jgi:hypothetical protein
MKGSRVPNSAAPALKVLKPHSAFLKGVHAVCWDSIGRRNVRGQNRLMAPTVTSDIVDIPKSGIVPDELENGSLLN